MARVPPDARFRKEIAAAVAGGAELDGVTLRLTLQDASRLARDRAIPVADIRFADGVMWFLGVRVESGGVPASELVVA